MKRDLHHAFARGDGGGRREQPPPLQSEEEKTQEDDQEDESPEGMGGAGFSIGPVLEESGPLHHDFAYFARSLPASQTLDHGLVIRRILL